MTGDMTSSIEKLATRRRRVAHCVGLVTKSHSHPIFSWVIDCLFGTTRRRSTFTRRPQSNNGCATRVFDGDDYPVRTLAACTATALQ